MQSKYLRRLVALALATAAASAYTAPAARAADHGDAPTMAHDQGADVADVFLFLDPNDNSRVVIQGTIRGFIPSGENVNFGFFDPAIRYRFEIENTGDAKPDTFIDVTFSQRVSSTEPQIATIKLPNGKTFTAPTTLPSLAATAPAFVVTTDSTNNAQFYAGMVDDPFFFDIPAFARFSASVRAGSPNPALFNRGRDSFAGYNVMAYAISLPASALQPAKGPTTNTIGVHFVTQRGTQSISPAGEYRFSKNFKTVDREGLPAVSAALIPLPKKNLFNVAKTTDDAKGKFAQDIINTLQGLGTNATNIGILADLAVNNGDILRLKLNVPNTGPGGGNNPQAAFPNGRRLNDDTIDTILFFVANQNPLSDNVNDNGGGTTNTFPFFALPNQPKDAGVLDDGTRN